MAVDWSALPLDLLTAVVFKLEFFEDFIYFSSVCRSWNHASSSIKHQWRPTSVVPWLFFAENTKDNPDCIVRKMFNLNNLNNNKCYNLNLPETFGARCWGSPYGWVVMVDRDLNVRLFNPITKVSISFPRLYTLPRLPENDERYVNRIRYRLFLVYFLTKFIVLKVPQSGNLEFVIMVLYSSNEHVAFARHGDQSWTAAATKETEDVMVVDVIGMDDYVFALYNTGMVGYWDINKLFNNREVVELTDYLPSKFNTFELFEQEWTKAYLVQSGSDLLLVVRYKKGVLKSGKSLFDLDRRICQTRDFKVYKVNSKDKRWEEIDDLGDVALFVGGNDSMCVTIGAKSSLERNSIYFTDDQIENWNMLTEFGDHDMGIYDIKYGQFQRIYEDVHTRSLYCKPTWFIPQF